LDDTLAILCSRLYENGGKCNFDVLSVLDVSLHLSFSKWFLNGHQKKDNFENTHLVEHFGLVKVHPGLQTRDCLGLLFV